MKVTTPQPTRMYYGGPIRMFSSERFLGAVPYSGGDLKGYAGLFVCGVCQARTPQVITRGHEWVCKPCAYSREHERNQVSTGVAIEN